jgi:hypothetical protein
MTAAAGGLAEGDWVVGSVNGVFAGVEVLGAIADPWGAVVSIIGGFVMEHVHPFPEWLDELCGNPDEIRSFALTWANVANNLDADAAQFMTTVRHDAGRWEGLAVAAYTEACEVLEVVLQGFAAALRGVGACVELAGGIVAGVRALVRDAISEIISWILGAAWKFLSPYLPKAIQELASTVLEWAAKIGRFLDDLVATMGRLGTRLDELLTGLGDGGARLSEVLARWKSVAIDAPRLNAGDLVGSLGTGTVRGLPSLAGVTYQVGSESAKHNAQYPGDVEDLPPPR